MWRPLPEGHDVMGAPEADNTDGKPASEPTSEQLARLLALGVEGPRHGDPNHTNGVGTETHGQATGPRRSLASASTYAPTPEGTPRQKPPRFGATLVEGSGPHLSSEVQSVLWVRLRVATLLLFALHVLMFLVRAYTRPTVEWVSAAVVAGVLGSAFALLVRPRPISLRQLRLVEVAVVGVVIAFQAARGYWRVCTVVEEGRFTLVPLTIQSNVAPFITLMLVYAAFIPNTWRRAAALLGAMAAAPLVVMALLRVRPMVWVHAEGTIRVPEIIGMGVVLLMGAAGALYVAYAINTLRVEAFEARKLGRYQLRESLGVGGMGEVYLAEHQLLKRPCAIKLIRPERAGQPEVLARFEREVRATAGLSHPNTVEIYDYGRTDNGVFYYVMEYLPGLNLAELVKRHGPMPPDRVIHLLRQTCGALREAHAMGLIHRDIKPANIFASQRGGLYDVAKLLDFGLVRPFAQTQDARLTQVAGLVGSPLYMSPEQATGGHALDPRADIYSVGTTAYFLLTGQPPFRADSLADLVAQIAHGDAVPPSKITAGLPADLEEVVMRCLEKRPDARYPDVKSLAAAFDACRDAHTWTQDRAAQWWAQSEHAARAGTAC